MLRQFGLVWQPRPHGPAREAAKTARPLPAPGLPGEPAAAALWPTPALRWGGLCRLAGAEGWHARILITTSTGACQGPAAPANHRVRGAGGEGAGEAFRPVGAPGVEGRRGPRGPGLLQPLPAGSSTEYLQDGRLQGHLRPPAPARARCAEPGPSAGRLRAATKVPKGASAAQAAGADRGRSSLLLGGRRKNCWQPG